MRCCGVQRPAQRAASVSVCQLGTPRLFAPQGRTGCVPCSGVRHGDSVIARQLCSPSRAPGVGTLLHVLSTARYNVTECGVITFNACDAPASPSVPGSGGHCWAPCGCNWERRCGSLPVPSPLPGLAAMWSREAAVACHRTHRGRHLARLCCGRPCREGATEEGALGACRSASRWEHSRPRGSPTFSSAPCCSCPVAAPCTVGPTETCQRSSPSPCASVPVCVLFKALETFEGSHCKCYEALPWQFKSLGADFGPKYVASLTQGNTGLCAYVEGRVFAIFFLLPH